MKTFNDEQGREWTADAREEDTPRHHGRWFLVLAPADGEGPELILPEVRWQSHRSAVRTLATMSDFELHRRLRIALRRHDGPGGGPERGPFGSFESDTTPVMAPGTSALKSGTGRAAPRAVPDGDSDEHGSARDG